LNHGISILMYHQVGEFAPMAAHRSTYCHVRRFRSQMAWLHRLGFNVLRMDEVLAALRGERPIPPRAVALTFDDGYENFYEHAYPVLQRYGFPAMVYLITGRIGEPAQWFAAEGRDTPPLMSADRIRQLRAAGVAASEPVKPHLADHQHARRGEAGRVFRLMRRGSAAGPPPHPWARLSS